MKKARGFTLVEVAVAASLLLVVGAIALNAYRSSVQTGLQIVDAASLEAAQSRLQAVADTARARGAFALRAMESDYAQVLYVRQSISVAKPGDLENFPRSNSAKLNEASHQYSGLAAFYDGSGRVNLVNAQVNGTNVILDPCQVGVRWSERTRFLELGTLEVATRQAVQRLYNVDLGQDGVYYRLDGEPWTLLFSGGTPALRAAYTSTNGGAERNPQEAFTLESGDPPGTVLPKVAFRREGDLYRLSGLGLYVEAQLNEVVRRAEAILPLGDLEGKPLTLLTECAPGERPTAQLTLRIESPDPEAYVVLYGPDPRVNGKRFGPGEYHLTVWTGSYSTREFGNRRPNTSGAKVWTLSRVDPEDPTRGYYAANRDLQLPPGAWRAIKGAGRSFSVRSFAPNEVTIRYEEAPAFIKLVSQVSTYIFGVHMTLWPPVVVAAAPPPALWGPNGERIVYGSELAFAGPCLIQAACDLPGWGADSPFLLGDPTAPEPKRVGLNNDERAPQPGMNHSLPGSPHPGDGVTLHYEDNPTYGTAGFPNASWFGTLAVAPGRWGQNYPAWTSFRVFLVWLFFFPYPFPSPCLYIHQEWDESQETDHVLDSLEYARSYYQAICVP